MYWNGLMQDRSFPYNSTKDAGKDGGIFYCCNGLNDLKALVDKGMEDFAIAGCTDFGAYEEPL